MDNQHQVPVADVEAAVRRLAETVERQRELVANLDAAGADTSVAEDLLAHFEVLLRRSEKQLLKLRIQSASVESGLQPG